MISATRRCLLIVAAAVAVGQIAVLPTAAQVKIPPLKVVQQKSYQVVNVFAPPPRELRMRLSRAKKALAEDRIADAIDEVAALLTAVGERDYFVGELNKEGTSTSLTAEFERLIAGLPADARRGYEDRFGAQAEAMLKGAIQDGDPAKLEEVSRKFLYTKAGNQALLLLGRRHLDQRRPLQAALSFQKLAAAPQAASQFDPELSVLLAVCWQVAGVPQRAQEILTKLRKDHPNAAVRVAETERRLFAGQNRPDWLPAGDPASPSREPESRGDLVLGKPSRVWEGMLVDPAVHEFLTDIEAQYLGTSEFPLPALRPTRAGDFVIARTPSKVVGLEAGSGKLVWHFPVLLDDPDEVTGSKAQQRAKRIHQRGWNDDLYGRVIADEDSVYFVDQLEYVAPFVSGNRRVVIINGRPQVQRTIVKSNNRLVALDLQREGAFRWSVGDADGGSEPKLAGAFFLGPPLPMMNQLYVLAEVSGEVRLLALDAGDGHQIWAQALADVGQMTIARDYRRRLSCLQPVYASGMLICPTGSGAVVGVNLATRSLRWGFQYGRSQVNNAMDPRMMVLARQTGTMPPGARVSPVEVHPAGDKFLFCSPETDQLYCLDLLDGRLVWKRDRADLKFVATAFGNSALLVGEHRFGAIRLDNGKPAWKEAGYVALPGGGSPSGRGTRLSHYYVLPTTDHELLQIDLRDGKVVARHATDSVLGNLISGGDHFYSMKPSELRRFDVAAPAGQVEPGQQK